MATYRFSLLLLLSLLLFACKQAQQADLIITNANIYTIDQDRPTAEALAVVDDRIAAVGSTAEMEAWRGDATEVIDAGGAFVMPGFIEGHGHFHGLGKSLIQLNLLNTRSWDEIVQRVAERAAEAEPGAWIEGRGWHQEKWIEGVGENVQGYPLHDRLSEVSPDNPVLLHHASGHAVFANAAAMALAGVNKETRAPRGGAIIRDVQGEPIGVFEENAEQLILAAFRRWKDSLPQEAVQEEWYRAVEKAQEECLRKGITSFQDAGSSFEEIDRYLNLAKADSLNVRLWVMVNEPYGKMSGKLRGFPIVEEEHHLFTCRAIKAYLDGALGSFGAWLLRPYRDKPGFTGQNVTPIKDIQKIADLAIANDMQLCVHAIGDRANRELLDVYENTFAENPGKENVRWRVEHAQHLDTADIPRFREMAVIASMQGIHCTSDAPFVVKRLGEQRARTGAYPWRSLLDAGVRLANGTDAPVEDVDPLPCLYASVTRKRTDSGLELYPEQSMTREEALYSYTMGNAYAAFEEDKKGSLSAGKLADIVILDTDLRNCSEEEILQARVKYTIVGGEVKYRSE